MVDPMSGWCMTNPFNMLSRCSVISVPSGFDSNGLPTGIQIVGRTYDDVSVIRAAAGSARCSAPARTQGEATQQLADSQPALSARECAEQS